MDDKRRKEIEFALNNTAAYPPLDAALIKGEIDFLSAALRDTWDAMTKAEADNARLKERNAELLHDVAWLFNHRATLVRFVRELRAANDDLVAVNETEIAELRQLIDAADAEWRRFVALTHDEQITELEQRWQKAEAENARLRARLEQARLLLSNDGWEWEGTP